MGLVALGERIRHLAFSVKGGNSVAMPAVAPIHILWDSAHIWGLMAWRAVRALGLPCRLVKGQEIAEGAFLRKPGPGEAALLLVPGGNARLKAQVIIADSKS